MNENQIGSAPSQLKTIQKHCETIRSSQLETKEIIYGCESILNKVCSPEPSDGAKESKPNDPQTLTDILDLMDSESKEIVRLIRHLCDRMDKLF